MDPFIETVRQGGSSVGAVAHLGSWELLAHVMPLFLPNASGTVYQRLSNHYIDAHVRKGRAERGLKLFSRNEGFQAAIQFLRANGGLGVLYDQHAGDAGLWSPLFGRLASTSPLAATMALRTGAVLVPIAVHTAGVARWRMIGREPIASKGRSADEMTAELNRTLEEQVAARPADWLWVHNRWKTPKPKFLLSTYKRGVRDFDREARSKLQPFRMVVRSPNWLGDAVMSIPAVRAIKAGRPDAFVAVLTPEKLASLWKSVSEVDEVILLPKGLLGTAATLRGGAFEAAIVFPNSIRAALEVWLGGIPRKVGYPGRYRARLLNQVLREKKRKKNPQAPRHQAHHWLKLAEFIGADVRSSLDSIERASRLVGSGRLRIAVCPGAEYGPAKRWFPERFAEVMRAFAENHDCEWVLVGVAKDAPAGEAIVREYNGVVENLIGKTTLRELMGELERCGMLLTNDTGTMHLAAHLGTPVVAIFGSTEPALTGPLGRNHRIVRKHVACSPCFLRECPIDFRCMKEVTPAMVIAEMEDLIARG